MSDNETFPSMPQSLQNAVYILTSPLFLMPRFHPTTIDSLSCSLWLSLFPIGQSEHFNITFRLHPDRLPPSPLLVACISTGVSWNEWCNSLMAGSPQGASRESIMEIWEGGLKWTGEDICPITILSAPTRLPQTVSPENADDGGMEMMVGKHSFEVTPPTLSRSIDESPSSSSSTDVTSASSPPSLTPSSNHSSPSSLPSASSSKPCHPRISGPQSPEEVLADPSVASTTAYKYQGGETNVLGGGVLLSGPTRRITRSSARLASFKENRKNRRRLRACSRVKNWRVKA